VNSAMGIVSCIGNATEVSDETAINNVPVGGGGTGGIEVTIIPATGRGDDDVSSVLAQASPQLFPNTANSAFTAQIDNRNNSAVKSFHGTGTVSFTREAESTRIITFPLTDNNDVTIDASTTSGELASDFNQQGHVREFKVMGTQVSTVVFP